MIQYILGLIACFLYGFYLARKKNKITKYVQKGIDTVTLNNNKASVVDMDDPLNINLE